MNRELLKKFQQIPGVGKSIAQDLIDLGFKDISELADQDPQKLYLKLCELKNTRVDRCMLYVFRCAVYFASCKNPDPLLLKWWCWKDKNL